MDDIVEFDPVTQSVTTLEATLPTGREYTSAATAPNGKIYVFGGNESEVAGLLSDIVECALFIAQYAYFKIITADANGAVTASSFNTST